MFPPPSTTHTLVFAADVADEAAEPRAQQAQLPMVTLELLGMSIARSHHRRVLGDAQIRLLQAYSAFIGQTIEPLDRGVLMALGCTVVSTVTRLSSRVRSAPASCARRRLSARSR
jgi:hypothetical protein